MNQPLYSRRRFVKSFALGTALSTVLGKPWRGTVLAECVLPGAEAQTATFKVRVSDYPALSQPAGSVRLGVNPVWPDEEPFPNGDFWPILINRGESGEFYVLDSECRHASCVVPTYTEDYFAMRCPCHGSLYDIDGRVLSGPTLFPLRPYPFEFDGDDLLTIHVPGLGFNVNASLLPAGGPSRLQLCFRTTYNVTYQVFFRTRVEDPWDVTAFSLTPDGLANRTSLRSNGAPASVYVDRLDAASFYSVAMVLSQV